MQLDTLKQVGGMACQTSWCGRRYDLSNKLVWEAVWLVKQVGVEFLLREFCGVPNWCCEISWCKNYLMSNRAKLQ